MNLMDGLMDFRMSLYTESGMVSTKGLQVPILTGICRIEASLKEELRAKKTAWNA
jgi:hypothetical protein